SHGTLTTFLFIHQQLVPSPLQIRNLTTLIASSQTQILLRPSPPFYDVTSHSIQPTIAYNTPPAKPKPYSNNIIRHGTSTPDNSARNQYGMVYNIIIMADIKPPNINPPSPTAYPKPDTNPPLQ